MKNPPLAVGLMPRAAAPSLDAGARPSFLPAAGTPRGEAGTADLFPEPAPVELEKPHRASASLSEWNRRRLAKRRARRASRERRELGTYRYWIDQFDTLTPTVLESFRLRQRDLAWRPLISIVMPVYDPDLEQLAAAVRSVRNQIYDRWELCIADDASTAPGVRDWLTDLAANDSRVRLVFRPVNGHISQASNSALALARGEYVALLDQDDLLRPHSLLIAAEALNWCPDAGLLYSDEDKIDADGERGGHYFKCDWNPWLFRSHNLVSHFGIYRRDLVRTVGGFRAGFEGAQDYDLALRCSEQLRPEQIVHLPFVLYHWRVHAKSTSGGLAAKPYATRAGERALQEHLARSGIAGRAQAVDGGYRVHYALPAVLPRVAIVIPTRNQVKLLRTCVNSVLEKTDYAAFEILIVDNGSTDAETLRYLRHVCRDPHVRVIRDDRPFNYSQLNNAAIAQCNAEFVCLMNDDIEVITPQWLDEMVSIAQFADVGAVGAKLLYPDGSLQHGGVIVGLGGVASHAHKHFDGKDPGYIGRAALIQELSAVTAACLLVRRSSFLAVGGLDERRLSVAFNDVDLCLKLREHGWRNVWTPYAQLYHHESVSRGNDDDPRKAARFRSEADYIRYRWEHVIRHDPAYSPNLTVHKENFELAFPPRVAMGDPYWFARMRPPATSASVHSRAA